MKWYWVVGVIAGIIGVGGGMTIQALRSEPAHWLVEEVTGVDKWEYHKPIFGKASITQRFTSQAPILTRIDVLVVDLKRQSPRSPLTLELFAEGSSQPIRTVQVSGELVRDDYYLPFSFAPVPDAGGRTFHFRLEAPEASADAPYAVRLTEDKQSIAFQYYRQTTKWALFQHWIEQHQNEVLTLVSTLILTLLAICLIPQAATEQRMWLWVALTITLLAGTFLQAQLISVLAGDPGGDAYYYLVAAKQISQGINPLAQWSYRLPAYPVLLVPAVLPAIPDMLWGRLVGIGITLGTAGALILLARELKFKSIVGLVAMAWLYFNTSFLITSLRPRPYTFFGLFLLLSVALMFRVRTLTHAVLWGILLGIMGMTRQEAYVPTMILGFGFLVILLARKLPLRQLVMYLLAAAVPLLLIVSPYFYANYRERGNPLATSYFNRHDLPLPKSLNEFWNHHLVRARTSLGTVWLPSSQVRLRAGAGFKLAGVLALVAAVSLARQRFLRRVELQPLADVVAVLAAAGLGVLLVRWLFWAGESWTQAINILLLAAFIWGIVEIIRVGRWRGVLVAAVAASQLLIATLFHPAPKHYQQTYPFLALAIAAALLPLFGMPIRRDEPLPLPWWRHSLRLSPLMLLLAILGAANIRQLENAVDELNYPAAPYHAATMLAERLETYSGNVAAEVDYGGGDGIYRLHSYQQSRFALYEEKSLTPAQQLEWLCQRDIRYIVDHDDLPYLTLHQDPTYADSFKFLFDENAHGRNSRLFRVSAYEFSQENCK